MPKIRTGQIPFTANSQSRPSLITVKDAITDVMLRLSGDLVVTGAVTLLEDNILRLVQRVQLLLDGNPFKIIGDSSGLGAAFKLLFYANKFQYGVFPPFTAPGVGVATHPFDVTVKIPLSLPRNLSDQMGMARHISSMIVGARDLEVNVDWGDTPDIFSAGVATLANVSIEVIAVTDPNLNEIEEHMILQEATQNLAVTAGVNAREQVVLNKSGLLPYIFMMGIDNGIRADAVWNRLLFLRNTTLQELDMSWEAMRAAAMQIASLQDAALPLGINLAVFDEDEDGAGALDVGDGEETSGWDLQVDHAALTAAFRLFAHHFALIPG